jgi:hypothetical protein
MQVKLDPKPVSISDAADIIAANKNIMIIAGAGVSVA